MLRDYGVQLRDDLRRNLAYIVLDPEIDNFTYDLGNVEDLVRFLADRLGADPAEVERYVREPLGDRELLSSLRARTRWRFWVKRRPRFGRRLGWYAIARLTLPDVIVETGIHDGLGSTLLLRALELNSREHAVEGELISFDPRPEAGWLVSKSLRHRWDPWYVTSQEGMGEALSARQVDFFIHDSDHTYEVEEFEFKTVLEHAATRCVLLSDNSHATSALRDMASEIGSQYGFYAERPKDHWYPGAGIGLAVVESRDVPNGAR
jgi:hypothetical protein